MTAPRRARNRHAPIPRGRIARTHPAGRRVVRLVPRAVSPRAPEPAEPRAPACAKCGSHFIVIEPAFVHCRYCGAMHRLVGGSLLAQEEFELRSGLRLAS